MLLIRLFGLNPKRSWASRLVSLQHNARIVVEALIIAGCITATWRYCYLHRWPVHVSKDGDKVMLTTATLICAAIFSVVAALIFNQTAERNKELSKAVLLKDKKAFLLLRDEKISIRMHVVLTLFSSSILILLFVADYETKEIGSLIIFTVAMVLILYFVATLEMQNVYSNGWFRDKVPEDWFTEDLDVFFQLSAAGSAPQEESTAELPPRLTEEA